MYIMVHRAIVLLLLLLELEVSGSEEERERNKTKQIPGDGGSRGETEPWSATIESEIEIRGWEASKDSLLL